MLQFCFLSCKVWLCFCYHSLYCFPASCGYQQRLKHKYFLLFPASVGVNSPFKAETPPGLQAVLVCRTDMPVVWTRFLTLYLPGDFAAKSWLFHHASIALWFQTRTFLGIISMLNYITAMLNWNLFSLFGNF